MKSKFAAVLIVVCMAVIFSVTGQDICYAASTSTTASGKCGDSLNWTLDSNGVMTISGTGEMWDFRDDAEEFDYHTCPWENYKSQIKKVVFKDGITYVGADAFSYCTNLTKIEFCDSITTIGCFAFMECSKLENFELPNKLESLRQQCFHGCEKLTRFIIPDSVYFVDAAICNDDTSITYIYVGANAGKIMYAMDFIGRCTALEEITVSPLNTSMHTIDGVLYSSNNEDLIQYPAGKKDQVYTVNENTKNIDQFAFNGAKYLKKIILSENVEYIGDIITSCSANPIEVNIYNDNVSLATDPFEWDTVVRCNYNSNVWKFCVANDIEHVCLEHEWVKGKTVAPTYTAQGYTVYTCKHCSETKKDNYVAKLKLTIPTITKIENTSTGVKLTLQGVQGATGYNIYRKTQSGSWSKIGSVASGSTIAYTDKTAKAGTTYIYIYC